MLPPPPLAKIEPQMYGQDNGARPHAHTHNVYETALGTQLSIPFLGFFVFGVTDFSAFLFKADTAFNFFCFVSLSPGFTISIRPFLIKTLPSVTVATSSASSSIFPAISLHF